MKFVEMKNENNENLSGLYSKVKSGRVEIHWGYPFAYDKVILFEVPKGDVFQEQKAIDSVYRQFVVQSPSSRFECEKNKECDYYIFPCTSGEEQVIRQENNVICYPTQVCYSVEVVESKEGYFERLFGKKKESRRIMKLRMCSNQDLEAKDLRYRIPGNQGYFMFPKGMEKGKIVEYELKKNVEIKALDSNILLEKVEML